MTIPDIFILLQQDNVPSREQIEKMKPRYAERGYRIIEPLRIQRMERRHKKDVTVFFMVEVEKESE